MFLAGHPHHGDVSAFSRIALHATFSIKLLFIPLISLLVSVAYILHMSLRIGDLTVLNVLIWKAFVQSYIEKTVSSLIFAHLCRPQANRTERVNRDLVQMIANYVNEQHDSWDQFLCEFAYVIRTAVKETTGKPPAELFLGLKLITPFQKLVMVSDETEFAVGDIERLFEEARRNTKSKHEKWEKYCNRRRRDGKLRVLDRKNNNVVVWKAGKRLTVNVDQVRIYCHRKCDETEIRTGSSDDNSLRNESSGFDRVQQRSDQSQYDRKKGPDLKRELEEKGLSFLKMIRVRHTNKTNKRGPLIKSIPSSWLEKSRIKRIKNEVLGYKRSRESGSSGPERKIRKGSDYRVPKRALSSNDSNVFQKCDRKRSKQDKVAAGGNKYNFRPRGGIEVESRPAMERKTQQGGSVRSRKGRGRNYNPYIEERTRSGNRNARRRGEQQREEQERKVS
ncbi:uncharacterized protein TNCV_250961 [Trichonephila clavipes]|nr:uncharacterized protein TNCV_250961 [Trichonephila clavipes]